MKNEREKSPFDGASVLDVLLDSGIPHVGKQRQRASYEVKRLSAIAGVPVVFELQNLSFNQISKIRGSTTDNFSAHMVAAGVVSPDFTSKTLLAKFSAVTASEAVCAMLLPGEIDDLYRAIDTLSGYRKVNIVEIKND